MVQSIFHTYCSQAISFLTSNPFIQSNPLTLVFLVSVIPQIFFPVPKSEFFIPIITNGGDASGIVIASTVGNVISEIILYYLTKHGSKFLQRKEMKHDIEIRHFIHRYSWIFFIISPFIPIGTDLLVIFAGIKRVKLYHIILPMSLGIAIKNIVLIILVLEGVQLLPALCNNF